MIQLNLLPDIKLDYIRAQRSRRLVMSVSVLVTGVAVMLLVLLIGIGGLQKKHLNDLTKDINTESNQLQSKPNVNRILTVQNQLESLTALHDSKPAVSRLFDYLNQVTPTSINITSFTMDFTQYTATITGTSDTLSNVNQYVDTLKATTYKTGSGSNTSNAAPAFSNVVLSSFGLNSGSTDASQAASYNVTLSYDKTIFDTTQKVVLTVASPATTRSQVTQPSDLFTAPATTPAGGSH